VGEESLAPSKGKPSPREFVADAMDHAHETLAALLCALHAPLPPASLATVLRRYVPDAKLPASPDLPGLHASATGVSLDERSPLRGRDDDAFLRRVRAARTALCDLAVDPAWVAFGAQPPDEALRRYCLRYGPLHLLEVRRDDELRAAVCSIEAWMARCAQPGATLSPFLFELTIATRRLARSTLWDAWVTFLRRHAHRVDRGGATEFLQCAIAEGDAHPVTLDAERWLARRPYPQPWLRRVGRSATGEDDGIVQVTFCEGAHRVLSVREGRYLVSISNDGLRVWDADDGRLVASPAEGTGQVTALALHPDGRRLASAHRDGTLRVWDLRDWSLLRTVTTALRGREHDVSFGPGEDLTVRAGDRLLCVAPDGSVRPAKVPEGVRLERVIAHPARSEVVVLVGWSVGGTTYPEVHVWDPGTNRWRTDRVARDLVSGIASADDPRFLLVRRCDRWRPHEVCDLDDDPYRPNVPRPAARPQLPALRHEPASDVSWLSVARDGVHALIGDGDHNANLRVRRVDTRDGRVVGTAHWRAGYGELDAHGTNEVLVTRYNGFARLALRTEFVPPDPPRHPVQIDELCVGPGDRYVLSRDFDGAELRAWDALSGRCVAVFDNGRRGARFDPEGVRLFLPCEDSSDRWCCVDLATGATVARNVDEGALPPAGPVRVYTRCRYEVSLPGGRSLVARDDGSLEVRAVHRTQCVLRGHTHRACCIDVSPDGTWAVSCDDETVRGWDLREAREIVRLEFGVLGAVLRCAILASGRIVVGDEHGRVAFYDLVRAGS